MKLSEYYTSVEVQQKVIKELEVNYGRKAVYKLDFLTGLADYKDDYKILKEFFYMARL